MLLRNCQIFTPPNIVKKMLDMLDYQGANLVSNTIFEPAFGDGAFLTEIVNRIVQYAQSKNLTPDEIRSMLDNVYGVEIDSELYQKTIAKLNNQLSEYGLLYDWKNLINGDSLTYIPPISFDRCVSNPPFIRVHALSETERDCIRQNYQFGVGNTDLYIVFFELCMKKMKPDGKVCFISPNSFLKNTSQSKFRGYLAKNNLVHTIIDYNAFQVFDSVLTYSAITLLDFQKETPLTRCIRMKNFVEVESEIVVDLKTFGKSSWILSSEFLDNQTSNSKTLADLCVIQYGVATNADSVYIVSDEVATQLEPEMLRPVIKGSTLDASRHIIFPYFWDDTTCKYHVISEQDMACHYPKTYQYLKAHKEKLDKRDMEHDCVWYQYARSQGIQNSKNPKLVLKHILSPDATSCDYCICDEKHIVYSGMFLVPKENVSISEIIQVISSETFYRTTFVAGKDMASGYKSINTKIVKGYRV